MPRVTTYNPKKVTLALGNHIASGFADDSFIVIEPAGDGNSYVAGADGEVMRKRRSIFYLHSKGICSSEL